MKRADILNKRTNIGKKILDLLIKTTLPITLCLATILFGADTMAEKLLNTSFMLSNPLSIFTSNNRNDEKKDTENIVENENPQTQTVNSSIVFTVSSDIKRLVDEAEKKYANSSNDGTISAEDYSLKNATAEYNGIYLRNTTQNHSEIDIASYLNKKVQASVNKNKPAVLIYHTHTSETYELLDRDFYTNERSTRSENSAENMVRVGEEICKILESNGYKTIHDKTVYDETLNGAYDRARENISKILKENPSIQVVLDIHRDSIYLKDGTRIKTVSQINGEKVAQIMITTGCEDGNVTDFPNWEKNLTFALNLQQSLVREAPSLMRPLNLAGRKYNMDLVPCALHIEIGTDANTLTEAVNSANIFGEALSKLLKGYEI